MKTRITNVEKEKNLLILTFEDNKTATFDFNKKICYGIAGRKVKAQTFFNYLSNNFLNIPNDENLEKTLLEKFTKEYINCAYRMADYAIIDRLSQIEKLFSFLDLLDWEQFNNYSGYNYFEFLVFFPLEKGLVSYLRNNKKHLTKTSYLEFIISNLAKKTNIDIKILNALVNIYGFDISTIQKFNVTLLKKMAKTVKLEFKNFYFTRDIYGILKPLIEILLHLPNAEYLYDENRDFKYNYENLQVIYKQEQANIILKNESILKPLEKLDLGEYQIIIPSTMEMFIDEGNQQNNCVGHFYHDSILRKENIIYFLRKKENLTKSFVTCRFSLRRNGTIETRVKNNIPYCNTDLFNKIDDEISKLVKNF